MREWTTAAINLVVLPDSSIRPSPRTRKRTSTASIKSTETRRAAAERGTSSDRCLRVSARCSNVTVTVHFERVEAQSCYPPAVSVPFVESLLLSTKSRVRRRFIRRIICCFFPASTGGSCVESFVHSFWWAKLRLTDDFCPGGHFWCRSPSRAASASARACSSVSA
jgi:hypothetical protein